eukprot:scaffold80137_cov26-Tisochrysis_lutea.AAC.1
MAKEALVGSGMSEMTTRSQSLGGTPRLAFLSEMPPTQTTKLGTQTGSLRMLWACSTKTSRRCSGEHV